MKTKKHIIITVIAFFGLCLFFSKPLIAKTPFNEIQQYKKIPQTMQGVTEYKNKANEKNMILKNQKVNDIITTITFTKPLTYNELNAYIKRHKITPKQIQARGMQGNTRLTAATKYVDNMDDIVKDQINTFESAEFVGYTDMYAIVDYKEIDSIEKDPFTFLIDSSADSYFNVTDEKYPHALTWLLEDLK